MFWLVLLARVILSWISDVPEGLRPVVSAVYSITEPVLRLARPLLPPLRVGMFAIDLSIILVFILLSLIRSILCR